MDAPPQGPNVVPLLRTKPKLANISQRNSSRACADDEKEKTTSRKRTSVSSTAHTRANVRSVAQVKILVKKSRERIQEIESSQVSTHKINLNTIDDSQYAAACTPMQDEAQIGQEGKSKMPLLVIDTKDIVWKATVKDDIEKFMYPSLCLETLYSDKSNEVDDAYPSASDVQEVLSSSTGVEWRTESKYVRPEQSGPEDSHVRSTKEESYHARLDRRLDVGEAVLCKSEIGGMKMIQLYEPPASGVRTLKEHASYRPSTAGRLQLKPVNHIHGNNSGEGSKEINEYQQTHMWKVPRTRENLKAIQDHSTTQGQIKCYQNKQKLFEKWKRIQVSNDHLSGNDYDAQIASTVEPASPNTLSPRSAFYNECIRNDVLPEPLFSRLKAVKEVRSPLPPQKHRMSLATVTATLVQSIRAQREQEGGNMKTSRKKGANQKEANDLALHLQHFGLGDARTRALGKALGDFVHIQVLNLSNNRLTDDSIIFLLQCLEKASLSSGNNVEEDSSIKKRPNMPKRSHSMRSLNRNMVLKSLNLSQNTVGQRGCAQIAHFLGICRALSKLDLSRMKLRDGQALAPLTTAIECHPKLQVVNLSHNEIGEEGGNLLGDMISQPTCYVQELNLSWNKICRSGAVAIGRAIRTNTALIKLQLAMNRFGDDGGEQLAYSMTTNSSLKELDLCRTAIGGRTAVAFGFYLRKNKTLERLELHDNTLTLIGTKALVRAVALGSKCSIDLSVHGNETRSGERDPVFDSRFPSRSSPFVLHLEASPYEYAVASELLAAAFTYQRCLLSDITYTDIRDGEERKTSLIPAVERLCLLDTVAEKRWILPQYGTLEVSASFLPPPMPTANSILKESRCFALITLIKRAFSSREMATMLDLVLDDLYLTTDLASYFISQLKGCIPIVDMIGKLWSCLIDGENAFDFLQKHLQQSEQRYLINTYGMSTIQFTTANPTGQWCLDLSDSHQRRIAVWFAILNEVEVVEHQRLNSKRTDAAQFGKGYRWRNVSYNSRPLQLTYAFFNYLPLSGILRFDYASTRRPEDVETDVAITSQDEVRGIMNCIGAEVFSIYIPIAKRKDLRYQLVLFHVAIGGKNIMSETAHYILQNFPKNYENCRLKLLISLHRYLLDLENLGGLLDRLHAADRQKVYVILGYLNCLNPLVIDMDYEIDFEHDDEKNLLRSFVELSIACPMDVIRIESDRSDVLVIYSMYQNNSVPVKGKMFFRYISHPLPSRVEWLKARVPIFRCFLCGSRLRSLPESDLLSYAICSNNVTPITPTTSNI